MRADSATGRGSAILATGDGQQQVYAVGDTIADGVTLAAIAADHVVLDRSGTREALWIDSGSAASVQSFDPSQQSAMPGAGSGFAPPPAASQGGTNNLADPADQAPPSGGGEGEAGQRESGQRESGQPESGRGDMVATTGRPGSE